MLSEEVLNKVVERLVKRIEEGNEYILTKIGQKVDEIGKLRPTEAQQLEQMLKYGGDYEKILNKLAKITKLNKKDIEKIFEEVAKKDYQFAEKFYKYRNKKYVPYNENAPLRKQVDALAKLTNDKYTEIARSKALGFSVRDNEGNVIFKGLKSTYNEVIDRAILNVAQGKITFQEEMYKILKDIGESGVKTLDFNGRTMRLDSAIKMHMKDSLRQLHNEMQLQYGEEFDADGVEISVHMNPAPDHEEVQGRQFSITEFNKFQSDEDAISYDGIEFTADFEGHDRRSISQYNCYHKIFPIILGVSKPEYSNEELQKIIDDNHKGFMLDGKKYTNYEGTQLQRQIEAKIREQKDLQILGRSSGNEKLAQESQKKINQLNKKYKELTQASGLPTYNDRMRVSGYRPIKVIEKPIEIQSEIAKSNTMVRSIENSNGFSIPKEVQIRRMNYRKQFLESKINATKEKINSISIDEEKDMWETRWERDRLSIWNSDLKKLQNQYDALDIHKLQDKTITLNTKEDCVALLDEVNIKLDTKNLEKIDLDVLKDQTKQYYRLCEKYPFLEKSLQEDYLKLGFNNLKAGNIGEAQRGGQLIELDIYEFDSKENALYWGEYQTSSGYNMPCSKDYYSSYFATHELGHTFNYRVLNEMADKYDDIPLREFDPKMNEEFMKSIFNIASKNTGISKRDLTNQLSQYGKTNHFETMAELFANANCGSPNALGEAFDEYFEELLK